MAFHGDDSYGGKLMNLFRLIAKYNPHAAAYIQKIDAVHADGKKMRMNFTSPLNQNRLLQVMAKLAVDQISQSVEKEGRFAIIADSTQDVSKKEITALLVRYLESNKFGQLVPIERLVGVFSSSSTSGEALTDTISELLKSVGLPMELLIGQSYDGAGNMRGPYNGLQTLIRKLSPAAIYVWCYAHRLSLVTAHVLGQSSTDIKVCIGTLEELHTFMGGYKRNAVFLEEMEKFGLHHMQVQRTDTTRQWSSAERAVNMLLKSVKAVVSTLDRCSSSRDMDTSTVAAASGLKKR
jgi:hypothetical protein